MKMCYSVEFVSMVQYEKIEMSLVTGNVLVVCFHVCRKNLSRSWVFWWLDIGGTPLSIFINVPRRFILSAPVFQTTASAVLPAHNRQPWEYTLTHFVCLPRPLWIWFTLHNATSVWLLLVCLCSYRGPCSIMLSFSSFLHFFLPFFLLFFFL